MSASSTLAILGERFVDLPKQVAGGSSHSVLNPYIYDPSIPLAVIGAIIFSLIFSLSIYQYLRHRSWFFWAAIVGVIMLALGHICRLVSALDENKNLPFLISWIMILLAPSFLAAACYTAFSRVVWFSCPTHGLKFKVLWCFPRWITPTFVVFDLLSFLIQLVGASQISRQYANDASPSRSIESSERKALPGRVILILGLVMQMTCFVSFSIISVRYFYISRHWRAFDLGDLKLWRKLSYTINVSSILIALRAIYRTMEIPHDKNYGLKYLQSHEWCFWVFDALPILTVLVVFAAWHPGHYLPRSYTGLALDKGRAVKEKDEITSMIGTGAQDVEIRDFKPGDFQGGSIDARV
ncbi:hypothetical protein P153DRAFT_340500 [Dothidotthia symphoricarpi CBS 119687]|uniref:RTA1-domain-containing protein n=1 Tax=Dothidotthia symphoricarpi CBS 119687 TaxID=1392245 RepID=A0A6A6AE31_9PLEO|nr:uncharacterized protein P153DRAFT_340500 [Dothidotthia symphoricarpi CBS 119687]KAF2129543.1 hypothetical protein P153DRAFT_340500 [Dothidotthia symphoricarpi CBS 119687]